MEIALTKGNSEITYFIYNEEDLSIKTVKLIPVFAARWRAICKYFINSENKQPGERYEIQQQYEEDTTAYTRKKKKFRTTKSKAS